MRTTQLSLHKTNWKHHSSHGGSLRQLRAGRGARPLSTKEPLHLVLKANRDLIKGGFRLHRRFALIHHLLQRYRMKFFIKVEQVSIQGDHIHLLIRTSRRSLYQHFFRVLAGQIAQEFGKQELFSSVTGTPEGASNGEVTDTPEGASNGEVTDTPKGTPNGARVLGKKRKLWRHRPFTRVVKGWRAYKVVRDYIQLNEKEALKRIPYRKERLRGLSSAEWEILWA